MPLATGTRLGPYEILKPLGAGGMGEVYRARDTRLERDVAIKVLAHNVGDRAESFQRFEREAQTISALNHPNICTLHDLGTQTGVPYLVMEYIEGETLSDRLMRGPLALDQMWRIAIQIGEALDQAHRHGIVHRDLKPGNVMLVGAKPSTTVKLLDFGLAKIASATRSAAAPGSLTSLPTVTAAQDLTVEGTIVGTVQYMSPEQLEGAEADSRSDIFAFGCVLYEMITGQKTFQGKSKATLISAILTSEPQSVTAVQPIAPAALDRVVRKCLAKNPDDRWQTARDLVGELRWISESSSQTAAPVIPTRRRFRFQAGWLTAAVLAAALAAVLAMRFREPHPVEHTMRFLIPPPQKTGFGGYDTAVLSPDATRIVFNAIDNQGNRALYLRSLDSVDAKIIPGTSGGRSGFIPFWSPDGRFIAFFADDALKKVDLLGGNPITLCPVSGLGGGTWNRDGVILFSSSANRIMRVSADGGNPTPVTKEMGAREAWPFFLPDGKHFLFTVLPGGGIYAASLDSLDAKQVSSENSRAEYSSAGFLVFSRGGTVMAQPFDAARLRVTGASIQIADRVKPLLSTQYATSSFSAVSSTLAYLPGSGGGALTQLTWFDRQGGRGGVIGEPADYSNPALSPDGRMLAVGKRDPVSGTRDIYTFDLVRGTPARRLTFDRGDDFNPLWSPDGQRIIFSSNRKGHRDLYQKASSGVGPEEILMESDQEKSSDDWTRDGRYVIYFNNRSTARFPEIWALPLFADRKPFAVISEPGNVAGGRVSPNGKWISYGSNVSGILEIYVQDFPPAGGKWQVSIGGGGQSSWNANGKELFYLQGNRLVAVDVDTESRRFEIKGAPRILFDVPVTMLTRNAYAVTTDGQKFLVNALVETKDNLPMTLVLNWPAALTH